MHIGTEDTRSIAALHTMARWYCVSAPPFLMPGSGARWYNHPTDDDEEEQAPSVRREWTRAEFWHDEFIPAFLRQMERLPWD